LQNKVVWITGATSGIGEQLALTAAEAGATGIVLSGRRKDALEAVRAACAAAGAKAAVEAFDVCDADAAHAHAAAALAHFGRVDVLVNCAGISTRGSVSDTALAVDRRVMDANFFGPVALTKAVLPHMLQRGSGAFVTVNSVQGLLGVPFRASYGASKHAATGFFDALRAEVAAAGLTVTSVYPGYVRTALSLNAVTSDGTAHGKMDAATASGMDPRYVARRTWEAAAHGRDQIILVELKVRLAIMLRTLMPGLMAKIMAKRARKTEEH
ncbi:unnamed protein product, partial [Phaeothamnion confervicola]